MEIYDALVAIYQTLAEAVQTLIETIKINSEAGTPINVFYKEVILKLHESLYGGWEETGFDKVVIEKVFSFLLNILGKK